MRKVFDLILQNAINAQLTPDEMIKTLFIFTDMQFDSCDGQGQSSFEYAQQQFEQHGYKLPLIVCWNLRTSSSKCFPTTQDEVGFVMLSGFSSELLKCVMTGENYTPMIMLNQVLMPYESSVILKYELNRNSDGFEESIKQSEFKKGFKKELKEV
jgi:hypothetical protein